MYYHTLPKIFYFDLIFRINIAFLYMNRIYSIGNRIYSFGDRYEIFPHQPFQKYVKSENGCI